MNSLAFKYKFRYYKLKRINHIIKVISRFFGSFVNQINKQRFKLCKLHYMTVRTIKK